MIDKRKLRVVEREGVKEERVIKNIDATTHEEIVSTNQGERETEKKNKKEMGGW